MPKINLFKHAKEFAKYSAGDRIFELGDPGEQMYVVKSGEVEIVVGNQILETLSEGDIFGEMAIIDKSPRSAAARAKTDCELVAVDAQRFTFLVQQTPMFALQVIQIFAERLRRKTPSTS